MMETVKFKASPEGYFEPCQTYMMENFTEIINSFQSFTIFTKRPITQHSISDRVLNIVFPLTSALRHYLEGGAYLKLRQMIY